MYSSDNSSAGIREEQQRQETAIKDAQKGIDLQFSKFTPDFYKSRENAYLNFALPQVAEQYQEAQKNLTYGLASKGLLKSGAAGTMAASLQKELGKQKQQVADTALNQANALRSDVESEQNRLLSQAVSALSPGATVVAARKSASQFEEPNTLAPVGSLFRNWTNQYVDRKSAEAEYGSTLEPLNFNFWSKDSSKQVSN